MSARDGTGSHILELGPKYIGTPDGKDLISAKGFPIDKLNDIERPSQRLIEFFKCIIDPTRKVVTYEAQQVRYVTFIGAVAGFTLGAIFHTGSIRERFLRKYNAAVFESQFKAQRMYKDYLATRITRVGVKYAMKSAMLSGGGSLVIFGSLVYRNQIYPIDWYVGLASLGAMTRFMLGPRAWIVGAGFGCLAATFGLGVSYSLLHLTGLNVSQISHLSYVDYMHKRDYDLVERRLIREKGLMESFRDVDMGVADSCK